MVKFKIGIPVFVSDVIVIYSTIEELKEKTKYTDGRDTSNAVGGSYINVNYDSGAIDHVIWINSFFGFDIDAVNTITHEAGHCVFSICKYLGVNVGLKAKDHHTFLYTQSYIVREIVSKLNRHIEFEM